MTVSSSSATTKIRFGLTPVSSSIPSSILLRWDKKKMGNEKNWISWDIRHQLWFMGCGGKSSIRCSEQERTGQHTMKSVLDISIQDCALTPSVSSASAICVGILWVERQAKKWVWAVQVIEMMSKAHPQQQHVTYILHSRRSHHIPHLRPKWSEVRIKLEVSRNQSKNDPKAKNTSSSR
jgi:hypothetical protein